MANGLNGKLHEDQRSLAARAADVDRPTERLDPVAEADHARAPRRIGTADAVVANREAQRSDPLVTSRCPLEARACFQRAVARQTGISVIGRGLNPKELMGGGTRRVLLERRHGPSNSCACRSPAFRPLSQVLATAKPEDA